MPWKIHPKNQPEEDTIDIELIFSDLVRFQIELWNAVDARLRRDHGHGAATIEPLRVVAGHGECRVNDISDELVITVGGASKLVDRLEANGFCVRRPNPDDRRSSLIALTPAGEAWLEAATATFHDELRLRLGDPLGDSRLAALGESLSILRSSAFATDPEGTTP